MKCCAQQKHSWLLGEKSTSFQNRKSRAPWRLTQAIPVSWPSKSVACCREDQHITTRQLSLSLSISKGSVSHIIRHLGYSKVRMRLVPQSLRDEHKKDRKAVYSELFACFEYEGEAFLSQIVTSDETWVRHCEPETRQSMEWHHPQSPGNKKRRKYLSEGKIMSTVFWDCQGVILVDAMSPGDMFNSNAYIRTLIELRKHLKQVWSHKDPT